MKDNKFVDTDSKEIQEILKSKFDDLSDSVDCFDRISAQAFKEENFGFSEDGFTVSGLENVTGKPKLPRFLKWTAVAAAAIVGISVIPQNSSVRHFFDKGDGNYFPLIIEELNTELESGQYVINDVPLEFYLENDILVTPLFCCPFEDCGKEDAMVRLFTKQIDGIDTTQMYAVLYNGTYTESNFIAVAESKTKFTDKEEALAIPHNITLPSATQSAISSTFADSEDGKLYDNSGIEYSVASFTNTTIMKHPDKGIVTNFSEIVYGTKGDDEYFYDIYCNGEEIPDRKKMWADSVYFNGNSSFAEESQLKFRQTDIFAKLAVSYVSNKDIASVYAFNINLNDSFIDSYSENDITDLMSTSDGTLISSIQIPFDIEALCTAKFYFDKSVFQTTNTIRTSSNKYDTRTLYNYNDDINISESEQQNLYLTQIKKAELIKEKKTHILLCDDELKKEEIIRQAEEEFQNIEQQNNELIEQSQAEYEAELQRQIEEEQRQAEIEMEQIE